MKKHLAPGGCDNKRLNPWNLRLIQQSRQIWNEMPFTIHHLLVFNIRFPWFLLILSISTGQSTFEMANFRFCNLLVSGHRNAPSPVFPSFCCYPVSFWGSELSGPRLIRWPMDSVPKWGAIQNPQNPQNHRVGWNEKLPINTIGIRSVPIWKEIGKKNPVEYLSVIVGMSCYYWK